MAKKSTRAEARKVKDRWRSKVWYNINAPEIFGASQIGETLADSPKKLEGRVTQITLQDITGDFSQMHVKLNFQIDRIVGLDAHTTFVGHDLTSDDIRRLTRRKHSKMDGIYDVVTLDGYRVRIKPMAITERRIKTSQQQAIRREMANVVGEGANKATLPEVIRAMISGEMSKMIFRRCKPIYPIKRVEIRRSQVLGRDFIPDTPIRGEAATVFGIEEPEPEAEEPAEGEEASEAETPEAEAPAEAPAPSDEEESEVDPETVAAIIASFEDIPGIGPSKAQALFDSGLRSVDEVKEMSVEDLVKVEGVSEALAQKVHETLNE
ncbi:MAG: 30S ribosomal protein S3ae [Candidatus Thermoplasmatota archaeon]|nr:30S ribosomal protein S3ae [Candidatus Thermoplasmatota archaeon]